MNGIDQKDAEHRTHKLVFVPSERSFENFAGSLITLPSFIQIDLVYKEICTKMPSSVSLQYHLPTHACVEPYNSLYSLTALS